RPWNSAGRAAVPNGHREVRRLPAEFSWHRRRRPGSFLLSPSRQNPQPLHVLFATPECAPLAKTGGLGDVSSALPAALRAIGLDARVLLPGYPGVAEAGASPKELARISVLGTDVRLLESRLPNGVPLIVVDAPP